MVVGAGPSGIAAAYTMAKAGLNVVVFERGRYPGSKNIFGGILFSTILNKLIPQFWKEAPVERNVTRRRYSFLNETSEFTFLDLKSDTFNQPPHNNTFTVLRAKFDRWFAKKAEEAGAFIIPETVVDDFIWKDGRVVGVQARREEGDLYADAVICAEGANSLLARKNNLRPRFTPHHFSLGVKEIISLPKEVIEDRFCLSGNEGTAMEFMGAAVQGMAGGGAIYTNRESLSVLVICSVQDYVKKRMTPNDVIEAFKNHPCIKPLVRGGKTEEFLAHMLPEGGYDAVPTLVRGGLLLVGDAAHLANPSIYHEATNFAMASGLMAGQTVIEAAEKGDFSEEALSSYRERLEESFVMKDLKHYRKFAEFRQRMPQFFDEYPKLAAELMTDFFTISETPKADVRRAMFRKLRQRVGLYRLVRDLIKFRNKAL